MDRDPHSLTDDLMDFDAAIAALDPQHFWKMNEASGDLVDSGYGNITLQDTGSPTYAQATGITGLTGVQFNAGAFFSPASALPASTTTFTILALIKVLHDHADLQGAIMWSHVTSTGFGIIHGTRMPFILTDSGSDESSELGVLLDLRQTNLIAVTVTAGAARFYRNGLGFDGDSETAGTVTTFTPTRVGSEDGSNRLRAVLSRLVYMPGVALTDAQIARIWSARFSCHAGTLAVVKQALAHLEQSVAVTNLSSDTTAAGVSFRLHYATAVESVLRAYAWPFATRLATLELVGGTASMPVNSHWQYSYRAPDRMIRALRIVKESLKRAHDPNPHPWELGQDALGTLVFTDVPDAELEYIVRPTCPALQGDALFREALAAYLAFLMGPTHGKDQRLTEKCANIFNFKIKQAEAAAANEEVPQNTNRNDPPWLTAR